MGRREKTLWIAAVITVALWTQSLTFYLIPDGQLNDDASFLLRALKLSGIEKFKPFHDPSNYALGWPLFLAPFMRFTGDYYFTGRCLAVALTAGCAVCLFELFRKRLESPTLSFGVVLLFLNSVQMLRLGSSLMSESLTFFLILATLVFCRKAQKPWHFALLGLTAGWGVTTRMESLAVVPAAVLGLPKSKKGRVGFVLACAVTILALRWLFSDINQQSHLGSSLGFFRDNPSLIPGYPWQFLKANSGIALASVYGAFHPLFLLLWIGPLAAVVRKRGKPAPDPVVWWLLLFPCVLFLWPYFNERYWVLWLVVLLGWSLTAFPPRGRRLLLALYLLALLPGALREYRLGPVAREFQNTVYLPYYRSLSQARQIMTLTPSRVATLSLVPASEPLSRTDYQSLPIGMAYLGCDVVEWETSRRHILTYKGDEARPFPPHAIDYLRRSSLFEPFHSCAFAESFKLRADPQALKQAGTLYSQAMQAPTAEQRLQLLEQALALVPDLPETRLALLQTRLSTDPTDSKAKADLEALYQQYPVLVPPQDSP